MREAPIGRISLRLHSCSRYLWNMGPLLLRVVKIGCMHVVQEAARNVQLRFRQVLRGVEKHVKYNYAKVYRRNMQSVLASI